MSTETPARGRYGEDGSPAEGNTGNLRAMFDKPRHNPLQTDDPTKRQNIHQKGGYVYQGGGGTGDGKVPYWKRKQEEDAKKKAEAEAEAARKKAEEEEAAKNAPVKIPYWKKREEELKKQAEEKKAKEEAEATKKDDSFHRPAIDESECLPGHSPTSSPAKTPEKQNSFARPSVELANNVAAMALGGNRASVDDAEAIVMSDSEEDEPAKKEEAANTAPIPYWKRQEMAGKGYQKKQEEEAPVDRGDANYDKFDYKFANVMYKPKEADKPASPVTQKPVDFFGREERDSSKFDSAGKQPLNRSETEQIRAETYRKSLNLTVDPAAIAAVEERYKHTLGKVQADYAKELGEVPVMKRMETPKPVKKSPSDLKAEALRESLRQTKAERDKKYAMECLSKEERRKRMDEERRESLQKAREAAEKRRQEEKEKYEKLGGVSKKKKYQFKYKNREQLATLDHDKYATSDRARDVRKRLVRHFNKDEPVRSPTLEGNKLYNYYKELGVEVPVVKREGPLQAEGEEYRPSDASPKKQKTEESLNRSSLNTVNERQSFPEPPKDVSMDSASGGARWQNLKNKA